MYFIVASTHGQHRVSIGGLMVGCALPDSSSLSTPVSLNVICTAVWTLPLAPMRNAHVPVRRWTAAEQKHLVSRSTLSVLHSFIEKAYLIFY